MLFGPAGSCFTLRVCFSATFRGERFLAVFFTAVVFLALRRNVTDDRIEWVSAIREFRLHSQRARQRLDEDLGVAGLQGLSARD